MKCTKINMGFCCSIFYINKVGFNLDDRCLTYIRMCGLCYVSVLQIQQHDKGLTIDPFRIWRATSIPLGKGTKFALHHRKMSTTKRRAIQILHISTFQFTFKCGYNDFISKYTDINSLYVTQINLLHNNTFCNT